MGLAVIILFFLFRVLERVSAKSLAAQLRLLADYVVYEMSNSPQLVNTVRQSVYHLQSHVGTGNCWSSSF